MTSVSKTSIRVTSLADTLHTKDDIVASVHDALGRYYADSSQSASALHPRYGRLLESMQKLSEAGGKRVRPYVAVLVYEAYGGNDFNGMVQVGAALELLHSALLIHDDIIDRDLKRHGILNVAGQYQEVFGGAKDAEHFASSMALLAGDLNLSAAYRLILESSFTNGQKIAVQALLSDAIFHVIGGELIDTDAHLYDATETDPLEIAALKSAHYTFIMPLLIGAILADAGEKEIAKLTELGLQLGISFQLMDDLLGMFGDENKTGKSTLSDIREGKRTWLAQEAFNRADDEQLSVLREHYGNADITGLDAAHIRQIFIDTGAREACEQLASTYATDALAIVRTLSTGEVSIRMLEELIATFTERKT